MISEVLLALVMLLGLCTINGFQPIRANIKTLSLARKSSSKAMIIDQTVLIAVGDYASEIESAVGTEVYSPIFKAGLFLFVSGIVSAFIAAFIISKSDTWDGLNDEFERGKMSKLIASDMKSESDPDTKAAPSAKSVREEAPQMVSSGSGVLDEVKDLDL